MLKIGLIVFVIVTIIAGSGIGIGLRNKKRNEKEEAIKEEFNLKQGSACKKCNYKNYGILRITCNYT